MRQTGDTETQLVCPITSTHAASFRSLWHEPGRMIGYRCQTCGEFSIDLETAGGRIAQYDDAKRERISRVIAEIWNEHHVAARLDTEAVDRLLDVAPGSPRVKELADAFRKKREDR